MCEARLGVVARCSGGRTERASSGKEREREKRCLVRVLELLSPQRLSVFAAQKGQRQSKAGGRRAADARTAESDEETERDCGWQRESPCDVAWLSLGIKSDATFDAGE